MNDSKNTITFRPAEAGDEDLIVAWHKKPHVQEFWDNSERQLNNARNFLKRKVELYYYWIGALDGKPYALLMTSDLDGDCPDYMMPFLSKNGKTRSIDFMIGEEGYVGKGLGPKTLAAFMDYIRREVEPKVDTFLIDPAECNLRAIHVYEKAEFKKVAEFTAGDGFFKDLNHWLMIKTYAQT